MIENFGALPTGETVQRLRLHGGGLTAHLMTYGAVLQDLRLSGHSAPLVLGFPEFAPYLTHSPYFGAMAGRVVNRIRDGHLELDGVTHQLDRNFLGKHTLHGGADGMGTRLWRVVDASEDRAVLGIRLGHGDMGFPGQLDVTAEFALLPGGVLDIQLTAITDATTLCNLAHHSYFNLDGGPDVAGHHLRVDAAQYLLADDDLIPTGELADVAGTRTDFRSAAPIGPSSPLDHNFCLSDQQTDLRPVAWLSSAISGVAMECRTTEPGLQIYDAADRNIALAGLNGAPMGPRAGLAMEAQGWPDSIHHPHFPQSVLRPGETYRQHTQFAFVRVASV